MEAAADLGILPHLAGHASFSEPSLPVCLGCAPGHCLYICVLGVLGLWTCSGSGFRGGLFHYCVLFRVSSAKRGSVCVSIYEKASLASSQHHDGSPEEDARPHRSFAEWVRVCQLVSTRALRIFSPDFPRIPQKSARGLDSTCCRETWLPSSRRRVWLVSITSGLLLVCCLGKYPFHGPCSTSFVARMT